MTDPIQLIRAAIERLPVTDHDGDDLVDLHDVLAALSAPVAEPPRNPDEFCTCGHRREAHHVWGKCHGMHSVMGKDYGGLSNCKCTAFVLREITQVSVAEPPQEEKAWDVDDVQAELNKPGYSILRGWLAIHGGASARIALEEMCQLIRAALQPASALPTEEKCEWRDDGGCYETSCRESFIPLDGCDLDFVKFCCYCGKPAVIVPYDETEPASALEDRETTKMERCPAKHPGVGAQCGLPRGHREGHTMLIPSDAPWFKPALAELPKPQPQSPEGR